ncbi:O-glucosyltransferase rumi homolog [Eumeta japonica]|uniref:O-glucosyltransferase rumi homolog n=1 Tax=Eumeta variegata TaxID=151549 RepID=A0A4C1UZ32_EUMVA|nr:O-glucosyltransferase rumi homolog [Eumeta japonica]
MSRWFVPISAAGLQENNDWKSRILKEIEIAIENYVPCEKLNCSCHKAVMEEDLSVFEKGINKHQIAQIQSKGTRYQVIKGKLYRDHNCHFPARCAGVEHYLTALAPKLPNLEVIINTRDWPQLNRLWGHLPAPIFSFSKTKDYYDIMYPAWSFWEGGPAISLYPSGIGRWDKHRNSINAAAEKWPWKKKIEKAFFRGSRTNEERDALVLLARLSPDIVDAQYTKNQAWKSDARVQLLPTYDIGKLDEGLRCSNSGQRHDKDKTVGAARAAHPPVG